MIKGTIFETFLREAVAICFDEYSKLSGKVEKSEVTTTKNSPRYIRIKDWPKYHDFPAIGGLRSLVFFAKEKGFEKCIKRVGRSVLIDEEEFFKWVKESK